MGQVTKLKQQLTQAKKAEKVAQAEVSRSKKESKHEIAQRRASYEQKLAAADVKSTAAEAKLAAAEAKHASDVSDAVKARSAVATKLAAAKEEIRVMKAHSDGSGTTAGVRNAAAAPQVCLSSTSACLGVFGAVVPCQAVDLSFSLLLMLCSLLALSDLMLMCTACGM